MAEMTLEGVELRLGGENYTLPPLNVDALEKYLPVIEAWGQKSDLPPLTAMVKQMGEVAEMLQAALSRNYPDLSLAEIRAGLDLTNFEAALNLLLETSGLARVKPGESEAGGDPTGATSGPESAASPAGPGSTSAGV